MAVRYQIAGTTAATISGSIESGVRRGALVAGQSLPPVRELAGALGVSAGTVAAAYQSLRQRGIVETAGRNGTRIRPRPPLAPTRSALRLPKPAGVLDLSAGEPDARLLPDLPRLDLRPQRGYGDAGPIPELIELATARLSADGVPVPALTVTGGALDGIDRLLAAHLRPGDRVGVEDPGWANLFDLVAAQGLTPVAVPVDEQGPTPEGLSAALSAGVGAVVVTTRAQNPTGAAVTRARATALRAVLRTHPDLLVVEDDHAAELAVVALHPLAGATHRWAFVRSVSKPYGPDLRLAVMAGDEATLTRVEGRMRIGTGWVSSILQQGVVALWRDDTVAARIDRARDSYARRRSALRTALSERGLSSAGNTGLNVWLPVPDETVAVARLRDTGYAVAPGSLFRLATPPAVRITVSPLSDGDIEPLADAALDAVGGAPRAGYAV
ncbi:aminotransferase class I/II-fold pyridoxal phosphate-dependent enzyme [Rugosimonospora africana]|uniref:GntR family transcriptional regulator n=1 Tax=Rugosimonospora africana TaxID=556532 RepID=A0A8J3QQR0_9ACTN|nr:aminotransferase class I/II-fold pyridoxal phosphate-dependent enzyme [Rugosimonospora africana]GIH13733.1 GntR family transcriptional regulator [Rugosimonospora africana]